METTPLATVAAEAQMVTKRKYKNVCKICGKHEDDMFFFAGMQDELYCLAHCKASMIGCDASEDDEIILDREGNKIIEIMIGKKEMMGGNECEFHSAIIIEREDGIQFFFCDHGILEWRHEMKDSEGEEI